LSTDRWNEFFPLPFVWQEWMETSRNDWLTHPMGSTQKKVAALLDKKTKEGLRMFDEVHTMNIAPQVKMYRFDTLCEAISSLFFNFKITIIASEALIKIQQQFTLLCSIYDSLPNNRAELPERLSNGLRSIVFEHVLFEHFERTAAFTTTTDVALRHTLLSHFSLQKLLQEEQNWGKNRADQLTVIQNLEVARQAIDSMVKSL